MPNDNMFNAGYDAIVTTLGTATGLTIADDPRNINPPCVLIDAPTFEVFNYNIVSMDFPIKVIGSGPGNLDSLRVILQKAAAILDDNIGLRSGRPATAVIGGTEMPAYELVLRLQAQTG